MMDPALENLGWTEEHWNRICSTVAEEAQKARTAAQLLPSVGPEDASTVAVPNFTLGARNAPQPLQTWSPSLRFTVDSDPNLPLTKIAVNVPLRSHEVADPNLTAALGMFRRAANYIARVEDALVFSGRPGHDLPPLTGLGQIPDVVRVTGNGPVDGLLQAYSGNGTARQSTLIEAGPDLGTSVFKAIIASINDLDAAGQLGPFACALSANLFAAICTPTNALVLPRDRILPFLQGPLLRASALLENYGVVLALSGNPIELVVASDISVRYLQTTEEPRFVFRVSERVALRIKEHRSIGILYRAA
jgi:uncharacterized linocin/CFP29 family protein